MNTGDVFSEETVMNEWNAALEEAFAQYRRDVDSYERRKKPTDGLLGFGRSLQDEPCNERLDEGVAQIAAQAAAAPQLSVEDAAALIKRLLFRDDMDTWPTAAQWMLRAVERHSLPLIPHLTPAEADGILRAYTARYPRWDRLPAQKDILKALKRAAKG